MVKMVDMRVMEWVDGYEDDCLLTELCSNIEYTAMFVGWLLIVPATY